MRVFQLLLVLVVILSLSSAHAMNPEIVSTTLWSHVYNSITVGNYNYAAFSKGLLIIDVEDPTAPTEVGRVYCGGDAQEVAVSGDYAYLANGRSGLAVIDISDKTAPEIISVYNPGGAVGEVCAYGDYLFTTNFLNGDLEVIDVSDPADPTLAYILEMHSASDLDIQDNYLYLARGDNGLQIYDITTPTAPLFQGTASAWGVTRVHVEGNYAYVLEHTGGEKDTRDGSSLAIIDIESPWLPGLICRFSDPIWATDVSSSGDNVLLTSEEGLVVVDVSDPENPVRKSTLPEVGRSYGICAVDDYAYICTGSSGIKVVDVSDPYWPKESGHWCESNTPRDVRTRDGYAYVVDGGYGLRTLDISDPASPRIIGHVATPGRPQGLALSGDYAYLAADEGGLHVIDISDPDSPMLMSSSGTTAHDIAIVGQLAYIAAGDNGLWIYNISDPIHPEMMGHCDVEGDIDGLAIDNGFAYLASAATCFQVVDVSDPYNPYVRGGYNGTPFLDQLVYSKGYVFAAAQQDGLWVINVNDPDNPQLVCEHDLEGHVQDIYVVGTYAYITAKISGGVQVIDISNPLAPNKVGGCLTNDYTFSLYVDDEYIYVADYGSIVIMSLPAAAVDDEAPELIAGGPMINFDNPAVGQSVIQLRLPQADHLRVDLLDVTGRLQRVLYDDSAVEAALDLTWDTQSLSSGKYYIRVLSGNQMATKAVTIVR